MPPTDKELMQQALDALDKYGFAPCDKEEDWQGFKHTITALRERLAQPEPAPGYCPHCKQYTIEEPMRREWVGLKEEEIKALPQWFPSHETAAVLPLIRAVEAKLREKNT